MNELALFAGIHGIGLGLKRAFERRGLPFRTVCYVEWDDYCVEVLKARMRDGLLGRGMDRVAAEVASSFYDIQGDCISAHAFGSPQVRERLFLIAYRDAINGEAGVGYKPNGQKPIFTNGDPKCSEIWVEAADKAARMDDGIPGELYRQRVEVLGNAVVPQVAEYVGERLIEWLDSGG